MKVIPSGKQGYGLLIEQEGFFLENEKNKFISEVGNRILNESIDVSTPLPKLYAVMQKCDIQNKNGRIYPEKLLKREVERYRELIKIGASAGELDHPECLEESTQILTKNGWKYFDELKTSEIIYTINTSNKEIELQPINKKIIKSVDSTLIHFKSNFIDVKVTPNHRMLIFNEKKEYSYVTAETLYNDKFDIYSNCSIVVFNPKEKLIYDLTSYSLNKITISKVEYKGKVVCVEVNNSNFYAKNNDKTFWTGNSSIISANNIALKVKDLWWDGATLMGEIELPVSKAFIEQGIVCCPADIFANHMLNGILLGLSSRGLGSVKKNSNTLIVQDDFELICWDGVSSPSTTGAWLYGEVDSTAPHVEKKGTFIESKEIEPAFPNVKKSRRQKLMKFLDNF